MVTGAYSDDFLTRRPPLGPTAVCTLGCLRPYSGVSMLNWTRPRTPTGQLKGFEGSICAETGGSSAPLPTWSHADLLAPKVLMNCFYSTYCA